MEQRLVSGAVVVGSGGLAATVVARLEAASWRVEHLLDVTAATTAQTCIAWINCTLPEADTRPVDAAAWGSALAGRTSELTTLCLRARAAFADEGGSIVNLLGVELHLAAPEHGPASIVEAAAGALTRTLGVAWAPAGIRVNGVAVPAHYTARAPRHPAGRLPRNDEIAEAIAFLAGSDASYITAEILRVDGGGVPINSFKSSAAMR